MSASQPAPNLAAADNPTPLRWGLDDVLHGDDDTTTVLLSGPGGEPYWLELEPERAAALRDALAGPGDSSVRSTALDVLRCLANPEACRWEGVYCVTHSWKSDIGRCPHGQAQVLLGGGR